MILKLIQKGNLQADKQNNRNHEVIHMGIYCLYLCYTI